MHSLLISASGRGVHVLIVASHWSTSYIFSSSAVVCVVWAVTGGVKCTMEGWKKRVTTALDWWR